MDPSIVLIIVSIILLSLILTAIGAYVVIHSSDDKEKVPAVIDVSGQYAVLVRPARDSMERVKPSPEEVRKWLSEQNISPEEQENLMERWEKSYDDTVRTIDEGDKNGTVTYRVVFGSRCRELCNFMGDDSYITREQIRNHAEILPPYMLGCECRLVPKLPWENPGKSGWKAVVPVNGVYLVPDWRRIA